MDRETPRGAPIEVTRVGEGVPPSQRKTRTSRDSTQNVRTCCCRESMETSHITTKGRTWTGELQTTLHDSIAGASSLRNQQAGTPCPLEWWGAASRQSWRWSGPGFSTGVGTLRDPLVFAHVVLTKTLGVRRAQEIRARITRRMDLWERGQHVGLVGDAEAEGAAREGRSDFSGEEEDNAVARSFNKTVLWGKLRQAVRWATNREGGGCLLPGDK